MLQFREVKYSDPIPTHITCILGADIGGTNANFGIFQHVDGRLKLLLSIHFKSQEITTFVDAVKQLLEYLKKTYAITITKSSFAVAGVVSEQRDYAKPTNLPFAVDAQKILQNTDLKCAFLVNDFEVIGYGLRSIDQKDLVQINKGVMRDRANKVVLGAGTGFGKCIMYYNKEVGHYDALASEGGHADFVPQDQLELDLVTFIRTTEQRTCTVSWEDILSGYGIKRMYQFFKHRNNHQYTNPSIAMTGPHPDEIFNSRTKDEHARNSFELYSKMYARCAKNFALDALALSGVYIAGGIAAKNLQLFEQKCFMQEFVNCGKQQELLKQVPIYVITDYNISLYGAAEYMITEGMCA